MDENKNIQNIFEEVYKNINTKNFILAENNLSKILDIDQNNIKALFLLGSIFLQTGKLIKSKQYLEKVIEKDPNIANAYSNLGIVYIKLKEFIKAKKFLYKALEINPTHLDAFNYLGIVYAELDNFNTGLFNVKKSLELDKNYVPAYNNLGLIYKKFNYFDEAEIFFKKAIEINSKFTESHYNLMELFEKGNQNEKLLEAINNFEKLFKPNPVSILYKCHALYKKELFFDAIQNLKSFSIEENLDLEVDRTNLLGKCYDKVENINDAFINFEKSNSLNSKLNNKVINKDNFLKDINIRIDFFKNLNLKKSQSTKKINYNKPVFMVGFPRSGTTLLDTILRSHPSIDVIEEKSSVKKIINNLSILTNNNLKKIYDIKDEDIKKISEIYFEDLLSHTKNKENKKIYIDKLPLNIVYIAEIIRIFPNAKFIISLRHPCDCVLSCFMQNFKLNESMSNFLNLNDAANTYDLTMSLFKIYKFKIPFNFYEIKYEKLVSNFNTEIKNVLEFLELPWDNSVIEYQKTANKRQRIFTPSYDQVIKPLYLKSAGRWIKYRNKLTNVYPILEPWIKELNYE